MAWGARSGLKHRIPNHYHLALVHWLNGLGSPFGTRVRWLNGLGSPFGIETSSHFVDEANNLRAKWPGEPVRD